MSLNYENTKQWFSTDFHESTMFARMAETVEASPWHREANVGVHTDMVVGEYIKRTDVAGYSDELKALGLLATAFHDVGKPASKVEKYKEDRGKYFAFHGHEKVSMVQFVNHALAQQLPFPITKSQIFTVAWMIQNHMPWDIVDPKKLAHLFNTANSWGGVDLYCDALLSDQYGRIADDQEIKNARANDWISQFRENGKSCFVKPSTGDRELVLMIGPPGAGKSTLRADAAYANHTVFSLDVLRHEWYDKHDYRNAFTMSTQDSEFLNKANQKFRCMVNENQNIVVDNTNMTRKSRASYINAARSKGYVVKAVWVATPLQVMIDRQKTRGDKTVPISAVIQRFNNLELPSLGEVDSITVV